MSETLKKLQQAIYDGDEAQTLALAEEALGAGNSPEEIIEAGVAGLEDLGKAFDELEVFLPELMLGGEAMNAMIEKLKPLFKGGEGGGFKGTIVMGCAKGDLHDIGLNLVATQLSVNGFDVHNLGTDVSVNEYVDTAAKLNADIIGVSSLLTTSAYYQEELIQRLAADGLRETYKVIVGGGPITPDWTRKIGADGYSRTPQLAVKLCEELMARKADATTAQNPIIME